MHLDIYEVMAGRQVFTPDEWPVVRQKLDVLGVGNARRVRLTLNHPEAGWLPVTDDAETTQRAPVGVDVFERLP